MADYKLKPDLGTAKQGFSLEDENGNKVYYAKMQKFSLLGASPFDFTNYITNKTETHKVGKTTTFEEKGAVAFFSTSSTFKFDDKKIWDYLHELGYRINSNISGAKLGMIYEVSYQGRPIAKIATSSPKGTSFITTNLYYDVECEEADLDLVFLAAFAIAKTDQTFYN